jgi:non-specific serine/threonine protein kinase
VLNNNTKQFPYFSIDVVKGETDEEGAEFIGTVEKLDVTKFIETEDLTDADKQLLQLLRRLQPAEISKFLSRNSPFAGFWENIIHHEEDDLPDDTKTLMLEYLLPRIQKLFAETNSPVLLLPKGKEFKTKNLVPVSTSATFLKPFFELKQKKNKWEWSCKVKINGAAVDVHENDWNSPLIFLVNDEARTWNSQEDAQLAIDFSNNNNRLIMWSLMKRLLKK